MFQLFKKASFGSLLIIGTILATSSPAFAQSYKGKCRDQIEGDLDSCRVILENNNLYLKFKESELNQTISLDRVDHLIMKSEKKDNWVWGTSQSFIHFSFSWLDGLVTNYTKFSLKDEDSRELISFLKLRGNTIVKDNINAYLRSEAKAAEDYRQFAERQYELEKKKLEQPIIINQPFPNNPLSLASLSFACIEKSPLTSSIYMPPFTYSLESSQGKIMAQNISQAQCEEGKKSLQNTGFFCSENSLIINGPAVINMPGVSYSLLSARQGILKQDISKVDCEQYIRGFNQ